MIDIHTHLIPGVDDGSQSMEMSLDLMLRAYDQGIRGFFATPHSSAFAHDPDATLAAFQALQQAAKRYFPGIGVYLGCEVECEAYWMDEVLDALDKGTYPTMNGTDHVLMEFSKWVTPENTLPCVQGLTKAGWKPIIAHMERYVHLQNLPELAAQFRDMGCRIQLNAYSLVEEMDGDIKGWARSLVRNRQVDFLGTDLHRTYHRPPSAATGLDWIYENCDRDYADAIAFGNAQSLLMDNTDSQ